MKKKFSRVIAHYLPQCLLLVSILTSNVLFPATVIAQEIENTNNVIQEETVPIDTSEDILEEGISTSVFEETEIETEKEIIEEEEVVEPLFVFENGIYTVNTVVEGEEYVYPDNNDVRVKFTEVTQEGNLVIKRVELTQEQKELLNTKDNYGWDITSSMENGTFKYTLTLPNIYDNTNVEVKYTEDSNNYESIEGVSNINNNNIVIEGLDHFTLFVVGGVDNTGTCTGASITPPSGTTNCYTTIQKAINAAASGDTINVLAGKYNENVTIDKPLSLIGVGEGNKPTIVGGVIISTSGVVRIENMNFVVPTGTPVDSIHINNVNELHVNNCSFNGSNLFSSNDSSGRGIQSNDSQSKVTVEGSTFSNGYYIAIQGKYNELNISNSTISNCKSGINFQKGGNLIVTNTNISVVAKGNTNDTYAVRFAGGSTSFSADNMTLSGGTYLVDKGSFTAESGTYHSAIIVRLGASGTLKANNLSLGGEVVNLSTKTLDATNNKWGTSKKSVIQSMITGNVIYDPWYGKNINQIFTVNEYEKDGVYYVKYNDILDFNIKSEPVYHQNYIASLWGYNEATGGRNSQLYIFKSWKNDNADTNDLVNMNISWPMVADGWVNGNAPGTPIPAGDYLLSIERYYEEGGYVAGSMTDKRITIDNTGPVLSVVTPTANERIKGPVNISITASDSQTDISSVSMHIYKVIEGSNNQLVTGCTSIPTTFHGTTWNATINNGGRCNLEDGTYEIAAWAYDGVKNPGWASHIQFIIDETPPTVEIISPNDRGIYNTDVTLSGRVTDANPHHYWLVITKDGTNLNIPSVTGESSATEFSTILTEDGEYHVTFAARDAAGGTNRSGNRSGDINITFTIDKIYPDAPTLTGDPIQYVKWGNVTRTWLPSNSTDVDYYMYENTTNGWTSGPYDAGLTEYSITHSTGNYDRIFEWKVSAVDYAGNETWSAETHKVVVDGTKPTVNIENVSIVDKKLTFTVSGTDNLSGARTVGVNIYNANNNGSAVIPIGRLAHNIDPQTLSVSYDATDIDLSGLESGVYTIRASITDYSGNIEYATHQIEVDNTAPIVFLTSPIDNYFTNQIVVQQTWDTDATDVAYYQYRSCRNNPTNEDCIKIYNEDHLSGKTRMVHNDNIAFWWQVRGIDNAGNIGEWSEPRKITIDTVAPIVSDIEILKDGSTSTYVKAGDKITIRAKVKDKLSSVKAVSADFSYSGTDFDSHRPTSSRSITMKNVSEDTYEIEFVIPVDWKDGDLYITVAARDTLDNYASNRSAAQKRIIDNTNLEILSIAFDKDPAIYTAGDTMEVTFTIKNNGPKSTSESINTPYLVMGLDRYSWTNHMYREEKDIPEILSGETGTVTFSIVIPEEGSNESHPLYWTTDTKYTISSVIRMQGGSKDYSTNNGNYTFAIDNEEPTTVITNLEDIDYTTNLPIYIEGISTDNQSGIDYVTLSYRLTDSEDDWTVIDTDQELVSTNKGLSFDWEYEWTPTFDGTYDIKVSATDIAGNIEQSAYIYALTYDSTAPSITVFNIVSNILNISANDLLSGTDKIEVKINDGAWTPYTTNMNLNTILNNTPGTYTIYVKVTDKAGNTTEGSTTYTIPQPAPAQAPAQTPATTGGAVLGATTTNTPTKTTTKDITKTTSPISTTQTEEILETTSIEEPSVLGERCENKKKVSGYVYIDKNKDKEMNENEEGIKDITLTIQYTDEEGNIKTEEEVSTDEKGYWETQLCSGKYNIVVKEDTLPKNIEVSEVLSLTVSDNEEETIFNIQALDTRNFWQKYWYLIVGGLAIIVIGYTSIKNRKKEEI